MSYKPKVYLSGGFKSNWQQKVIKELGDGFIFFNPREHGLEGHIEYWAWDTHFVKECDIIFAYMENTNPSGYGLSFELGLGHALDKTIILVDERSRTDQDFERHFKIVRSTADVVFDNLSQGIEYMKTFSIK